jgi:hypothetical protein
MQARFMIHAPFPVSVWFVSARQADAGSRWRSEQESVAPGSDPGIVRRPDSSNRCFHKPDAEPNSFRALPKRVNLPGRECCNPVFAGLLFGAKERPDHSLDAYPQEYPSPLCRSESRISCNLPQRSMQFPAVAGRIPGCGPKTSLNPASPDRPNTESADREHLRISFCRSEQRNEPVLRRPPAPHRPSLPDKTGNPGAKLRGFLFLKSPATR